MASELKVDTINEKTSDKGVKINKPPAGDGTPSKKLFFHTC